VHAVDHVHYGMMMPAAPPPRKIVERRIAGHSTGSTWPASTPGTRRLPAMWVSLCTRGGCAVDDAAFPGDERKVLGTTLGIQKLLLTRGFLSIIVCHVPGSATPAGTEGPGSGSTAARPSEPDDGVGRRGESGPERGDQPRATPNRALGSRSGRNDDEVGADAPGATPTGSRWVRLPRCLDTKPRATVVDGRDVVQRSWASGDRPHRAVRATARRAFGHDGRCEQVERKANAGRSICGGSSHLRAAPGGRDGFGRSAPRGAHRSRPVP
jgi:hypothetical protein